MYGAHGYLMTQFLSAHANRRTDGYGGSLANRGRFWLETLAAVREAVGGDCAVATRIAVHGDSGVPGAEGLPGIHADDMLTLVKMADDLVDLWDVTVGSWPEDSGTSRYYPEGHERPWAHRIREATAKPVVAVGRYSSPDLMAEVIRSGAVDLIGSARQAIADPFLPRKIAEGRLDEIRECTGSNVCILREETFHHVGCVQNATAGEEYRRGWHPESFPATADPGRAVLVVGAGPAGMECAVVLGKRGFTRRAPGGGRAGDRRQAALDQAAAHPRRLGADHRLARGPARQAARGEGDHRAQAGRGGCPGLRRGPGGDRYRLGLAR